MAGEVRIGNYGGGGGDEDRVVEWEDGLPNADDLTPLSQALIPPGLAFAFRISPEPYRTAIDVNRASKVTFSSLQTTSFSKDLGFEEDRNMEDEDTDLTKEGSDSRKSRRIDAAEVEAAAEEADSAAAMRNMENFGGEDSAAAKQKRPRLVWTAQLHKRFLDVVARLGISKAVPKTIMQLMNVEGLTRENVASHLQKYRLYLKRLHSNEGPSPSDNLFTSPQSFQESGGSGHSHSHNHNSNGAVMPIQMPYPHQMIPFPMFGVAGHGHNGASNGYHHHHQYYMNQQSEWGGNRVGAYHHVAQAEK